MDVVHIKKTFSDTLGNVYEKGNLKFITPNQKQLFINKIVETCLKTRNIDVLNYMEFFNLDDFIKPVNYNSKFNNLLIVRSGGIGDIIALSSIIDYFEDKNIFFLTQKKYYPLFEWFNKKPFRLLDYYDCIFKEWNKQRFNLSRWRRFNADGLIEKSKENWFKIFFEAIGIIDIENQWCRPDLKKQRINNKKSGIQLKSNGKKSLLICNKATAMMRSIELNDILDCLPANIYDNYQIFTHKQNIQDDDNLENITILETDLEGFLLDSFDADEVIATDTGVIHFREGIQKHCIALFNSFTIESRTKYYEFIDSFQIKSDCNLQPCFLHETDKIKFCSKCEKWQFSAPCFNSKQNMYLKTQLKKIFKDL